MALFVGRGWKSYRLLLLGGIGNRIQFCYCHCRALAAVLRAGLPMRDGQERRNACLIEIPYLIGREMWGNSFAIGRVPFFFGLYLPAEFELRKGMFHDEKGAYRGFGWHRGV